MPTFIPGLELSQRFYRRIVAPILTCRFPRLPYSAALIGPGSEVLGIDDVESCDHHWGPRLLLFLRDRDHATMHRALCDTLARDLPVCFLGYSTNFSPPDPNDANVRHAAPVEHGPVNHMVEVHTVGGYFRQRLGFDPTAAITLKQWRRASSQTLLELTAGKVLHDGLRTLAQLRRKVAFYPRPVWLALLADKWDQIADQEAFVGRTAFLGDDLGSRLIAAHQVHRLMELCFLMERRYAPYAKWFGTLFAKLRCAERLAPILADVLSATTHRDREKRLSAAYETVVRLHNRLRITRPMPAKVSRFHGRPYLVIHADHIARALRTDP